MKHSHVVIINWRSAAETIECLTNLTEVGLDAKIVVTDNASGDGSVAEILAWARRAGLRSQHLLESGIDACNADPRDYDIVVIENAANNGFAGGVNPGIKFAATRSNSDVIWLLNNDARIDEATFPVLRDRLEQDPKLGFVGSVIRYYETPDRLQCFGGLAIHPRLGKASLCHKERHISELNQCHESQVDCLMGASMAFRAEVVKDIGLLDESYFMYSEEMDWQLRAKRKGWKIGVEPKSQIFHKGSHSLKDRSHMYHFYVNRAAIMFVKRFFGFQPLLTAVPALSMIIFVQNWRRPKSVAYGWKGVWEGVRYRWQVE